MITHNTDITLDLSTDGERAEVWAKQDDTGSRAVTATFVDNGSPVSLSSVDSAELRVLRPDGAMVAAAAEISGNTVTAVFPETALEVGGEGYGDIRLLDSSDNCISAARFILHISPAAVSNDQAAASSDLAALLNSYMGGLHFAALTESEYAALDPKDPNTLYIAVPGGTRYGGERMSGVNLGSSPAKLYLGEIPISTGGGTILPKNLTTNGTYNASSDNADGYSPVTVNVPQPVITTATAAADLTGYEAGDTDLGNGFTITNTSGIVGVGSETIDGVTYSGLEMGGAATFRTMRQLSGTYRKLEFQLIPTAWASGDMRIVSSGGYDYAASVWTSLSNPYLMYVLSGIQVILDPNLVSTGSNNYYDPDFPLSDIVGKLLTVKYTYVDDKVVLSVNGVDKACWTLSTFNSIIASYGLNVGANGAAGADMLAVKAEYSGETLEWDERTWVPV